MDQDFRPNPTPPQPQQPVQPTQPVMDIQVPSQVISPQQPASPAPQPPTQPNSPVSPAPNQPAPSTYGMPPAADVPPQPNPGAQEVGVPQYEQQHPDLNSQVNKKRRGLILVIVLAIIVTVGLIGAAGYAYWQSRNNNTPTEPAPAVQEPVDDGRVDEADIDATTQEIDNALNSLNDSEDFGSDALSDKTIGL